MADSKSTATATTPQDDPSPVPVAAHEIDIEQYRATVPLWKRVWQHSLTQMILLSVQAFCGPATSDAIAGPSILPSHDIFVIIGLATESF